MRETLGEDLVKVRERMITRRNVLAADLVLNGPVVARSVTLVATSRYTCKMRSLAPFGEVICTGH